MPHVHLDWSHIHDDTTLHLLMNAVLRDELGFAGYTPGDPKGGKDRGWDGHGSLQTVRGTLRFAPELGSGLFMFQAKHCSRSGLPVRNILKRYLLGSRNKIGEIRKAEQAGADYLVVFTQAMLQPDDVAALEALVQDSAVRKLIIVPRERFQPLISHRPWLLSEFFCRPTYSALLPLNNYREATELPGVERSPFLGREGDLDHVQSLVADIGAVVLLHGSGGRGKTRLLGEFLLELPSRLPMVYGRILDPAGNASEALTELDPKHEWLVCVDDADREFEKRVASLAAAATGSQRKLRLVLTARTGAHLLVKKRLLDLGVVPREHELGPLSEADELKLIEAAGLLDEVEQRNLRRRVRGNLFLLTYALAALRNGEAPLSFARRLDVVQLVVANLKRQALAAVAGIDEAGVMRVLTVVAAIAPFPRGSAEVISGCAKLLGLSIEQLDAVIEELAGAGVLRLVGSRLRFSNDVVGDMVVVEASTRPGSAAFFGRLLRELHGTGASGQIITNLATVSLLDGPAWVSALLRDVVVEWRQRARQMSWFERRYYYEMCSGLAAVVPAAVLDLVHWFVANPAEDTTVGVDLVERPTGRSRLATTDDLGPALEGLTKSPEHIEAVLLLLERVPEQVPEGRYDNYKPRNLVASIFNPYVNRVGAMEQALDVFERWVRTPLSMDSRKAELVAIGLEAALAGGHEIRRYEPSTVHMSTRLTPLTSGMIRVRDRALNLWLEGLRSGHEFLQELLAENVTEVGDVGGHGAVLSGDLRRRETEETQALVRELALLVPNTSSLRVQRKIDSTMMRFWLLRPELEMAAADVLRSVSRTLEYRAYMWSVDRSNAVSDFGRVETDIVGQHDRWKWWCYRWRDFEVSKEEEEIAAECSVALPDFDALLEFLRRVPIRSEEARGVPRWLRLLLEGRPAWLKGIHERRTALRGDELLAPWCGFLDELWLTKELSAWPLTREELPGDAEGFTIEEVWRVFRILAAQWAQVPAEERLTFLAQVARHPELQVRRCVLEQVAFFHDRLSGDEIGGLVAGVFCRAPDEELVELFLRLVQYSPLGARLGFEERKTIFDAFERVVGTAEPFGLPSTYLAFVRWCLGADTSLFVSWMDRHLRAGRGLVAEIERAFGFGLRMDRENALVLVESEEGLGLWLRAIRQWRTDEVLAEDEAWKLLGLLAGSSRTVAQAFVERVLRSGGDEELELAAAMMRALPVEAHTPLWVEFGRVAERASKSDLFLRAAGGLGVLVGSYSWASGEVPPHLVERRSALRNIQLALRRDGCSVAECLTDAVEDVQRDVERHEEEIEEREL